MLIDDEGDDEAPSKEDEVATRDEVFEAAALARSDAMNLRLLVAARFILGKTSQSKRFQEPDDLLQDAIEAVLSGRRKWIKNRVDFRGLLFGVMRSLASSQEKSLAKTAPDIRMEHELKLVGDEQESPDLEDVSIDTETPEVALLRNEDEAMKEGMLTILRAGFGPEDIHGRILDEIRKDFISHFETYTALGIDEKTYRNAWKKLMRAADSLNRSAKE